MKKNKLLLVTVVSVFLLLFGVNSVKAKTTCEYKQADTGRTIQLVIVSDDVTVIQNGIEVNSEVTFNVSEYKGCPDKIYTALANNSIYESQNKYNSYKELNLINSTSDKRPKASCGNITGIPKVIPRLTSLVVTIIQIAVPVLLVIMGSIDLFKGITASKDDEMKKGQKMFIKRLVIGALVFFIIAIVKLLVSVVANSMDTDNISSCISCFISNDCN